MVRLGLIKKNEPDLKEVGEVTMWPAKLVFHFSPYELEGEAAKIHTQILNKREIISNNLLQLHC